MKKQFYIENVKCNGCVTSIQKGLGNIVGISNISVVVSDGLLTFESETDDAKNVENELRVLGYPLKK